jgi:hypothetical protein
MTAAHRQEHGDGATCAHNRPPPGGVASTPTQAPSALVPNFARSSLGAPAPSIASTWIAGRGHLLSWTIRACRLWLSLAADPFGNHCPEGFRRRIRRELALRLGTEQPDLPFREDKAFAPRHDVQMGEPTSFNHRPRNAAIPKPRVT